MFEEQNKEQVVEEVLEVVLNTQTEETSASESPSTPAKNVAEIQDYLNPQLFNEIKTIKKSDLLDNENSYGQS